MHKALGQYLSAKLDEKKIYTNSKFSRKLLVFLVKLLAFYDKLLVLNQILKINFKKA